MVDKSVAEMADMMVAQLVVLWVETMEYLKAVTKDYYSGEMRVDTSVELTEVKTAE